MNEDALQGMPATVAGIVEAVRGVVLHPVVGPHVGVEIDDRRRDELNVRTAAGIVDAVLARDPSPLVVPRPPEQRISGTCRHFTALAVALLRRAGHTARARCGFADYLQPGRYIDHWVTEYRKADRWALVDEELGTQAVAHLNIDFDPLDVPRDRFFIAGDAWRRCRAGEADPDLFGIFDWHGWGFIAGNILRDVAALNEVIMLPWDMWGAMGDSPDTALFDHLAALTTDPDANMAALRTVFADDARVRVPPVFKSMRYGEGVFFDATLA